MEKKVERWTSVYTTYDESEAAIIQGFLENEGIPCRVESSKDARLPFLSGKMGEIKILVHPEDFDKTAKIMEAARAQKPDEPKAGGHIERL
ncbi:MAG: putative signal transducing protein [Nitrospirota bacterium]